MPNFCKKETKSLIILDIEHALFNLETLIDKNNRKIIINLIQDIIDKLNKSDIDTYQKLEKIYPFLNRLLTQNLTINYNSIITNNFERKNYKFIIKSDQFLCVIKEILPFKNLYKFENSNQQPYQDIISIYYDNKNNDVYKIRNKRNDKASLIRLRRYGLNTKEYYLETKIHHKKKKIL